MSEQELLKTPWRASSSLRQQSTCTCYTPTPQHCPTSTCFLRRDTCCLCWRWRRPANHHHHQQSQATEIAGICVEKEVRRNCQRYAYSLARDAYRRLFWPLHHVKILRSGAPTESKEHMGKHRLGYHVRISWVRRCGSSTYLDLVQGSAQLRAAFPALAPDTEHASLLWRRRCRACEKVTHAMAAVPSTSGAPARAALKALCCLCMGCAGASHTPQFLVA